MLRKRELEAATLCYLIQKSTDVNAVDASTKGFAPIKGGV